MGPVLHGTDGGRSKNGAVMNEDADNAPKAPDGEIEDDALRDAQSHPARELLEIARKGDRQPLADHLADGAELFELLEERASLSGAEKRRHIFRYRNLKAREERFLRSLADPELLWDLSLFVRAGKMGAEGPDWKGSKSKRKAKLAIWSSVDELINSSDPKMSQAAAIRRLANDEDFWLRHELCFETGEERIKAIYTEMNKEACELKSAAPGQTKRQQDQDG